MEPPAVGIDLGTTNSVIAHINDAGRPEVIPNGQGNAITPSVLYFGSDPPLIGDEAKEMQALGEEDVASFFKRSMGDPHFLLLLGGKERTPVDLSALLLAKLKLDGEARLGTAITHAVITVPAYFNNLQREATIEAGRRAGLEVLRIINEPTAAALAYGLHQRTGEQRILVYDLGGGTFDVSLVTVSPEQITVVATDGDHNLGGKDWDDRISTLLAQEFANTHGTDPLDDNVSFNDLLVRSEMAKKTLSSRASTRIAIQHGGRRETFELTRERFQELTRDLMERTQRLVEQVLQDADVPWKALDGVLLVGGSTRMPMVQEYVTQMSGRKPMVGVNVDEAVALGAAVQAAIDIQDRLGEVKQKKFFLGAVQRIQDVMSHSLGTVAVDSKRNAFINSVIIPKNKPIPSVESKSYELKTRRNENNRLDVYLLQGESEDATQCQILGKYVFSGITHVPRYPAIIDIQFGYDRSGVIAVSAWQRATGNALSLSVEPVAKDMSWLSSITNPKAATLNLPYTPHAGCHRIPGAITDRYGNASGAQYDLVGDNAFEGCTIAVLHLCTGEGFDFRLPAQALKEKGFAVRRWTRVPDKGELAEVLEDASQLWVISDRERHLGSKHLQIIRDFFDSGGGIYIWGDNDPFYADANYVAKELLDSTLYGDSHGDKVLRPQTAPASPGFASHLITTAIEYLYEGITVASVRASPTLQPLMFGSDASLLIATYDDLGKRAIIDGGFTRLCVKWDSAGTGRYVKNAASWLANYERLVASQGIQTVDGRSSLQIERS